MKFKLLKEDKIPVFIDLHRGRDGSWIGDDRLPPSIVAVNDEQEVNDAASQNAPDIVDIGGIGKEIFKKALERGDSSKKQSRPGESDGKSSENSDKQEQDTGWGSYHRNNQNKNDEPHKNSEDSSQGSGDANNSQQQNSQDDATNSKNFDGSSSDKGTDDGNQQGSMNTNSQGNNGSYSNSSGSTGDNSDNSSAQSGEGNNDSDSQSGQQSGESDGQATNDADNNKNGNDEGDWGNIIYHSIKDPRKKYIRVGKNDYKEI